MSTSTQHITLESGELKHMMQYQLNVDNNAIETNCKQKAKLTSSNIKPRQDNVNVKYSILKTK